ncbi:MAG TPA: hypothetical protein VHW01_04270 [Polyangiaceae bacterium]|nr:hypothetical protein [Polyangiaceae bacterium]
MENAMAIANCTKTSDTADFPVAKWVCVEWNIDAAKNEMHLWLDQPQAEVDALGSGAACVAPAAATTAWLGLKAWRTPGAVDGNACVFCHGPEAIEFAALGYTDSQIYRRAFTHVDQSIADDVTIWFTRYARSSRSRSRRIQPWRGRFSLVASRCPARPPPSETKPFGQELKDVGMTLMGPPINSAADAKKAWAELLALNLRTLKVGIPLNHYTEDIFDDDGATPTCTGFYEC